MTETHRSWVPVNYSDQGIDELADLAKLVYGKEDDESTNPEFLRWLYLNNPAGRAITWVVIDRTSGILVGSYSVVPLRMLVDGEQVTGSVSVNLVTHPDYRKQGIFKALGQAMHTSCADAGILLSVSLAHGGSYPGFVRSLKFHDLGRRVLLVKALRLSNLAKRIVPNAMFAMICAGAAAPVRAMVFRSAPPRSGNLEVHQVEIFDARFDELWDRARGSRPTMFLRSAAHLNWRYFGWPPRSYRVFAVLSAGTLRAYVVTRTMSMGSLRATVIVDALVDSSISIEAVWRTVMPEVEQQSAEEDVDLIATHVLQHDPTLRVMRSIGYRPVPPRFLRGPNALCVGTYLNNKSAATALQYRSWYFMSGDNDVP